MASSSSGQQDDASAYAPAGASLDGLPAFFTNGSVDDKKYESLLEDLRAHDLLGPAESGAGGDDGAGFSTSMFGSGASGSSLFFNNAFSAVFMGNFSDTMGATSNTKPVASSSAAPAKPPPGFARAPPGLAPTETDLKWARGQQEFSRLEGKYHHGGNAGNATSAFSPGGGRDDGSDMLDASEIPSLKALGLDDDDAVSPVKKAAAPTSTSTSSSGGPPPAPSAIPPPPGAWQQPAPPAPPGMPSPQQQQQQYHQQQQQYQQQHHVSPPHGPPAPPGMQQAGPYPPHPHPHPHGHHHAMPHQQQHLPMPPPYGMRGPPPAMQHMQMQMRGPPPPPPPGAVGPGGMPYPPPMMMAPPPPPPPHQFAPRFKMMTPRDINFVMQMQTKQIRSSDPFSDDYYFHNYVQKRSRGPAPRPGGRGLPLPSWKLEHVKSVDGQEHSRAAKSREWETENHVLGRNNSRSLYRPKQSLNLGAAEQPETTAVTESAESTEEQQSVAAKPVPAAMVVKTNKEVFGSDLWLKRHQIDRGLHCLLSLQDARHLLDARGINVQQFHSMDEQSMDPALAELRTRTTTLLLELASLLGVSVAAGACDVAQLHRILSVPKGKRLVSRALPLLHPSARFVLLPHLVEYLLAAPGMQKIRNDVVAADDEDERLCQTIVLTLLFHPPPPSADLLTECLARAMSGHDLQSLRVLLYNRGRAEALQALLQRGGASIADATEETKQKWTRSQESFVALATAIKQTA